MHSEIPILFKSFVTYDAFKRAITVTRWLTSKSFCFGLQVCQLMRTKIRFPIETLVTECASIWTFTSVHSSMYFQICLSRKAKVAYMAHMTAFGEICELQIWMKSLKVFLKCKKTKEVQIDINRKQIKICIILISNFWVFKLSKTCQFIILINCKNVRFVIIVPL